MSKSIISNTLKGGLKYTSIQCQIKWYFGYFILISFTLLYENLYMIFYFYLFIYFLPNQVNYIYFLTVVEIFKER